MTSEPPARLRARLSGRSQTLQTTAATGPGSATVAAGRRSQVTQQAIVLSGRAQALQAAAASAAEQAAAIVNNTILLSRYRNQFLHVRVRVWTQLLHVNSIFI